MIGRAVLEAFVGPHPALEAAHIDGNAQNNRLSNLQWKTHIENLRDRDERHNTGATGPASGVAKLSAADVTEIRALCASGLPQRAIAQRFGVRQAAISHIMCGRTWSHLRGEYNITSKCNVGRTRKSALGGEDG
jgi:hypothetical protein